MSVKGGLWLNRQQVKWLVVLLALLPLVPTGLLVRLMVQNAAGDREAAAVELASAYQQQLKQIADRYSVSTDVPESDELKGLFEQVFGDELEIAVGVPGGVDATDLSGDALAKTLSYEIAEGSAAGWNVTLSNIPEFTDHLKEQRSETLIHAIGILIGVTAMAGGVWFAVNRRLKIDELRTDLVTTVSHEIKTPVAASRVLLETLCHGDPDERTQSEYLDLLERENERLGELAEQFLTFARLDRGQLEVSRVDCEIVPMIREQMDLIEPRFQSKGGRLSFRAPDTDLFVRTDPSAIKVILMNLLGNALKYGGSPPEARIESGVTDHGFWIAVSDKGDGIPPGSEDRLFREFDQGDRQLASNSTGIGLGLAISQRFARLLGGEVHFSEPDDRNWNTRFALILPLT